MSSHREAPGISKDPVADSADLYAFVSPENPSTVTIIANYVPLQQPAGGPNFYEFGEDVLYEIHIDNDADARADITYQFRFKTVLTDTGAHDLFLYNTGQIKHLSDSTWNRKQFYSVTRVDKDGTHLLAADLACPPCNVGKNSIPAYAPLTAEAVHQLGSDSYVFAGQRADGFYVDLGSIFDLGDLRPFQPDFLLKGSAAAGINTLAGLNVHSIAIQVPIRAPDPERLAGRASYKAKDAAIGVWTTASRQKTLIYPDTHVGPWTQISRLGNPLINEVIIPMGVKDYWNTQAPSCGPPVLGLLRPPDAGGPAQRACTRARSPTSPPTRAVAANTRPDLDAVLLTGVPAGLIAGFQNYTGPTKADMLRLNVAIKPVGPVLGQRPRRRRRRSRRASPTGGASSTTSSASSSRRSPGALLGLVVKSFKADAAAAALYDVGGPRPRAHDGGEP